MIKSLVSLSLFLFSYASYAGGFTIKGGGQGLECTEGAHTSVELLEFYEARTYGFEPSLDNRSDNFSTNVEFAARTVLKRVAEIVDPPIDLKDAMNGALELANISFTDGTRQVLTNDYGTINGGIPKGCRVVQLSTYSYSMGGGVPNYRLDPTLWSRLSDNEKVVLILHEALHGIFSTGPNGTRAIRQLLIYVGAPDSFRVIHAHQARDLLRFRRPLPNGF